MSSSVVKNLKMFESSLLSQGLLNIIRNGIYDVLYVKRID